ncbi:hypothetical protein MNBD_ALPHA07-1929 [hydrothermal vent metagenome]|uniref:Uncharacterized protein n=1 Tax=hydrothermal vent metagenome TaxID=652676 RepID=A0A3B0S5C3_9ZZZZ
MTRLVKILTVLAVLGISGMAQAVTSVTSTPSTARINDAGQSVITIRWQVTVSLTGGIPTTILVSSPSGALGIGGMSGGMISKSFRHSGLGSVTVTLSERLRVDRTTARRLSQVGTTTYTRTFSDNTTPTPPPAGLGTVTLQITSGGALSFRNFALRFDDDTLFKTVGQNQALTARAILTTNGRGIFRGSWEISGPSATQGAGFRPIRRVRQVLAGSRKTIFESPQLPTGRIGIYRVRFIPDGNVPRGQTEAFPVLTYSVLRGGDVAQLDLLAPKAGGRLNAASRFKWRSVEGAISYRVEFLSAGAGGVAGDRLAAMDVKSNSARLRGITLARLQGDTLVYWRVTAYDGSGQKIAISPIRRAGGG